MEKGVTCQLRVSEVTECRRKEKAREKSDRSILFQLRKWVKTVAEVPPFSTDLDFRGHPPGALVLSHLTAVFLSLDERDGHSLLSLLRTRG
jgi:hypothetical protein